jgi:hyperosmotically inducible periplasmic protein
MKASIARSSLVATVVSLVLLAGCAASASHDSTGQYIDDATITAKVKTQLLTTNGVSGSEIGVETVRGGEVQLSGFARSAQEKSRAGEIARSVPGVTQVHNDIRIR